MMRGTLIVLTFISLVFFPWQLTAMLALLSSFFMPFMPLAVGMVADALYYAPQAHTLPFATIIGAAATGIAFFVRDRLRASMIGK